MKDSTIRGFCVKAELDKKTLCKGLNQGILARCKKVPAAGEIHYYKGTGII